MWEAITSLGESPRSEFVYNLDDSSFPLQGHAAIRSAMTTMIIRDGSDKHSANFSTERKLNALAHTIQAHNFYTYHHTPTYRLTAGVVGTPLMILQPVSFIFAVLHCPLGLCEL